jgi:hypothetical protein
LLVEKIKAWIDSNQLGSLWNQAQLPLRLIGGLILFVIVSTVYSGILGTINKVPLAPGLLELTGVIWLLNYARCNLVRSSDRKRVIDAVGIHLEQGCGALTTNRSIPIGSLSRLHEKSLGGHSAWTLQNCSPRLRN